MARPLVATVILNWNGGPLTVKCLEHLARQTLQSTMVVVDNGSTDGSVESVSAASPVLFELVSLRQNVGFAAGMNAGIRHAMGGSADYVWVLNNDAFAEPTCLETLVRFMDGHPAVAAVVPRLLGPDGAQQHAGGIIDWQSGGQGFKTASDLTGPAEPGTWLSGTALLIRATSLSAVGLFDPEFFAYWEDVDLSLRLAASGADLRAVPEAVVHHRAGSTSGGSSSPTVHFLDTRNEWRVIARHAPQRWRSGARARYSARMLRRAGFLDLRGQAALAAATVRGVGAALAGRFGPPPAQLAPGPVTRAALRHPWRLASMLEGCVKVLERRRLIP